MGNSEIALLVIVVLFVVLTFIYAVTRADLEKEMDESEAWGESMHADNEMLREENKRLRAEVCDLKNDLVRLDESTQEMSREEFISYVYAAAVHMQYVSENINAIVKKLDKEAGN